MSEPETHSKAEKVITKDEHWRLGGRPPLITILSLGFGPIISEIIGALYGIVDTIWVSVALGYKGMSAISEYSVFDNMGRSFGAFLNIAANTKTSQLYGLHKEDEIPQVFSDMIRLTVVFSILVPLCFIPITKPIAQWYGAEQDLVDLGYEYIVPLLCCAFSTEILFTCGGFLQGEGRTNLYGIINIIGFFLNMGVFDPIFLLGMKLGIRGAAFSTILSELIPGVTLLILFYCGKFEIKPNWRDLFKKFSPHTLPALSVGISQLIAKLSLTVPCVIIRKFLGVVTGPEFGASLSGYNATVRFILLTYSVMVGVNTGFTPAAAYAHASKQPVRWLSLAFHAVWINAAWGGLACLLTWLIPRSLSLIFSSDPDYLRWAIPMMRTRNCLGFAAFFRFNAQAILQSMQCGGRAMILSLLCQFISLLSFSYMYFAIFKDGIMLMLSYPTTDIFGLVAGSILISPLLYQKIKEARMQRNAASEPLLTNENQESQNTYT